LNGKMQAEGNGKVLYLIDAQSGRALDSTIIEDGRFEFNTKLPETPIFVKLKTKYNFLYTELWLDNNAMVFDAKNKSFSQAAIHGSKAQAQSEKLTAQVDTLPRSERNEVLQNFIFENNDNLLGVVTLYHWFINWGKERTEPVYNTLSDANRNTVYGKEIDHFLTLNTNPDVGDQYVDVSLRNPEGETKKISEFMGKTVLLEFWSTTCAPCRKDNVHLVGEYEKYSNKKFEIISVAIDTDLEEWKAGIEEDHLKWINLSDLNGYRGDVAFIYGIKLLPSNYLINEEGKIIARNLRGDELTETLRKVL